MNRWTPDYRCSGLIAEVMKSGGTVARAFAAQVQRIKRFALLELLGFFVIFTCMILMRFGV